MAFEDDAKKELKEVSREISKGFPPSRTSLASTESLSLPMVHEVVLSVDMQCEKCLKRISDIIAKMNVEAESVVVNAKVAIIKHIFGQMIHSLIGIF
ncbi:unnamed protein product [Lupinus luteus]|uniref:HMA domain-containing protein n=1 Tax=Lupinus luteus TaxID=3873 RepID=A0AAV1XYQ1_LUPLU